MRTAELIAADRTHLWHPFTQMKDWCDPTHEPLVLVEGRGALLRDSEGREYLDGNSSIWTNIHGHAHPRINQAIKEQLERVAHVSFLGTTNEPAIELGRELTGLMPGRELSRVFYSDDGSTAIEVALKMSLQYWQLTGQTERRKFVAFDRAYHGDTVGASSLGGVSTFTSRFSSIHFPIQQVPDPASLRELDPRDIAAVVIEPLVQGAAGIRLWPAGMLRELRAWCDETGVLLIFDEVFTGFGRTGRMFACENEDVLPDFLCLAKGLTGGYLPLAATLTRERIYEAFLGDYAELKTFFYGHSYCGNPLGCAAALASLAIFREEGVLEQIQPRIAQLERLLAEISSHPHILSTRQCGLIAGIEVGLDPDTPYPWQAQHGARVCMAARRHGLLTRSILDTVTFIPPLCTTEEQITRGIEAIRRGIDEVCGEAR